MIPKSTGALALLALLAGKAQAGVFPELVRRQGIFNQTTGNQISTSQELVDLSSDSSSVETETVESSIADLSTVTDEITTTQEFVTLSSDASNIELETEIIESSSSVVLITTGTGDATVTATDEVFSNTTASVESTTSEISSFITSGTEIVSITGTDGEVVSSTATDAVFANSTNIDEEPASSTDEVTTSTIGTELVSVTGTGDLVSTSATDAVFSNTTVVEESATATEGLSTDTEAILVTGTAGEVVSSTAVDAVFTNTTSEETAVATEDVAGTTVGTEVVLITGTDGVIASSTVAEVIVPNNTITDSVAVIETDTAVITQTATVVSPHIIIINQFITIFTFASGLGGVCPPVLANPNVPGTFIVDTQPFTNLPAACSAACNKQLAACLSLSGTAFSAQDCQTQFIACTNQAQQFETITKTVPATITQTVVLPEDAAASTEVISSITSVAGISATISTKILSDGVVATIGESGVSLATVTKTALETKTNAIETAIVQTLAPQPSIIVSDVTVTVTNPDGAQETSVQAVTETLLVPHVTTITAEVAGEAITTETIIIETVSGETSTLVSLVTTTVTGADGALDTSISTVTEILEAPPRVKTITSTIVTTKVIHTTSTVVETVAPQTSVVIKPVTVTVTDAAGVIETSVSTVLETSVAPPQVVTHTITVGEAATQTELVKTTVVQTIPAKETVVASVVTVTVTRAAGVVETSVGTVTVTQEEPAKVTTIETTIAAAETGVAGTSASEHVIETVTEVVSQCVSTVTQLASATLNTVTVSFMTVTETTTVTAAAAAEIGNPDNVGFLSGIFGKNN